MNILEKHQFDLMPLDWILPSIDSIKLIKKIRKLSNFEYLPIVMLIAKSSKEDQVKDLDKRIVDVHALRVRKVLKLHKADKPIQTTSNMGYWLSATAS